jgi:hypothetical protein
MKIAAPALPAKPVQRVYRLSIYFFRSEPRRGVLPPVCSFTIRHGLVRKTDRGLSAPPSLLDRLQADTGAMRLPRGQILAIYRL